jgi:predicted nucleic acid-binding protein
MGESWWLWDASALSKRYFGEAGSETVNALFSSIPYHQMATTPWSYAETYSILLRRYNGGMIDLPSFTVSLSSLQAEVVDNPSFGFLSIDDATVFASIALIRRYNLNATDAALLTTFNAYRDAYPNDPCVIIASDHRLLRAATAEGYKILNPELLYPRDLPQFIAGLDGRE